MHDIRICKRQLKILGVDLKALNLTSKVAGGGGIIKRDDSDVTAIEIPAICGPNSKVVKLTRNPADIKKIKYPSPF